MTKEPAHLSDHKSSMKFWKLNFWTPTQTIKPVRRNLKVKASVTSKWWLMQTNFTVVFSRKRTGLDRSKRQHQRQERNHHYRTGTTSTSISLKHAEVRSIFDFYIIVSVIPSMMKLCIPIFSSFRVWRRAFLLVGVFAFSVRKDPDPELDSGVENGRFCLNTRSMT